MSIWSVDELEGGIARLVGEDERTLEVPASLLPAGTHEGDCLTEEEGAFAPNPEETARRRALLREKRKMLLQKSRNQGINRIDN